MKRRALILGLLVSVAVQAAEAPARTEAVLSWKNQETLSGEIVEASPAEVAWKTPIFEGPLLIRWDALHRIDLSPAKMLSAEPFSIALRDGSLILGDLVAVTAESVSIRSARHGEAILKRSEVISVRRIRGGHLTIAGPVGDTGWEIRNAQGVTVTNKKSTLPSVALPPLRQGAGGTLAFPYWNRTAFLGVKLPDRADLEFRLRSSRRPEFQLSLEGTSDRQMNIETWDNDLVLTAADGFKLIRKIGEDEREVALRVCWDRNARTCSVFSAAGEWLTDWKPPAQAKKKEGGLLLHNKGRDLSLEFLRLRAWDGKPPQSYDGKQPRLELSDGRIVEGEVISASGELIAVKAKDASNLSFPFAEVDAWYLSAEPFQPGPHSATLAYADGTMLVGKMEAIKEGKISLKMSAAEESFVSTMDGLLRLLMDVPAAADEPLLPPLTALDLLVTPQATLHGKLMGTGESQPRWLPVGGAQATSLSKTFAGEITRAFPPDAEFPSSPGLFYTGSGDVLPGEWRTLDRSGVEFESSIVEITKLPSGNLDAIQLGVKSQMNLKGFSDVGWRILKGDEKTVRMKDGALSMEVGTSLGHPNAMQSSEIEFSVVPGGSYTGLRLRLFCEGTEPARSTNLMLFYYSNRLQAGIETSEGQWQNQFTSIIQPGKPTAVRLLIDDKHVEVRVNGLLLRKFPISQGKRAGEGLIIEPAAMFGNEASGIELSGFVTQTAPGRTWLPDVPSETKMQALTVPRFRKDNPPRHALIATNGDVLRGEIEAITPSHFGFRSGLETLRVPRERVKAAIWLKKAEDGSSASTGESPALKLLEKVIERRSSYSGAGLTTLIGVLQREVGGLKIKLPEGEKPDARRFPMQFGGQTVGEALEQICTLFGVKHRLEKDGTIVLTAPSDSEKDLITKSYWLKADAFPKTPSVQEIVSRKGVTFPQGAALIWRPEITQLSMTNTEANQFQLESILKADFGGAFGAPTHWLSLTNGARLGLVVEQFDPEFILGHHPRYGRCKVPMAQVSVMRTTMPAASATMKSLKDWRLTHAPEPVLPETGGESSPMLGKEAKTFKLALLGGGDFDLSEEKGKVIVLDFWATWCGPCIKSLPGLMKAMAAFPVDKVKLIGLNQGEPGEQVKRFLEARDWKLTVAMDSSQSVARQYGVDGIPHTVIVGPDGKVAWVKTGFSAEGEVEAAEAVKKLLSQ